MKTKYRTRPKNRLAVVRSIGRTSRYCFVLCDEKGPWLIEVPSYRPSEESRWRVGYENRVGIGLPPRLFHRAFPDIRLEPGEWDFVVAKTVIQ